MRRKYWWPGNIAEQIFLVRNFREQIGGVAGVLGLTAAQVTAIEAICDAIIEGFNITEQCKQTMRAMTAWRDDLLYSPATNSPVPAPPEFAVFSAPPVTTGVVNQFFQFRDMVIGLPGYTQAIGQMLGIIGSQQTRPAPEEVAPEVIPMISTGGWVNFTGSMRGMAALRVEYAPRGGEFRTVGFLTNTPGGFQITPTDPGRPESGTIRTIFVRKNADYGRYSANYPVVIA
jgi:hypothetical protein